MDNFLRHINKGGKKSRFRNIYMRRCLFQTYIYSYKNINILKKDKKDSHQTGNGGQRQKY